MTKLTIPELEKRVTARLQAVLDRREPVLTRLSGTLGLNNDTGSAAVPGKTGWVYVRIGNDETLATAFNNRTNNRNGTPVIVGYDPVQPRLFQVLSTREVYEGQMSGGGVIPNHHAQHEFGHATGGDDVVWIRMRQLTDLLVYPTNPESLSINIASGFYLIGATVYDYDGGTEDLTSAVPGSGQRWVLVAIDETGVYTVNGTATTGELTYADIPDTTDPTHYKLAAIHLKAGDSAITDWPNDVRFVDLRLAGTRSMAGGGGWVEWENVEIVAKSGGEHTTVQAGENAAGNSNSVFVMPGNYAENVVIDTQYCGIWGAGSRFRHFLSRLTGADDTGPLVDCNESCAITDMDISRTLSGGSGTYIGVDASPTSYTLKLQDCRVVVDGGATGRNLTAVKVGGNGTDPSYISRCWIEIANGGGTDYAIELVGGAGGVIIEDCDITGDVVVTTATDVRIRNCRIYGSVMGTSGANLEITDSVVIGLISGWDSGAVGGMSLRDGGTFYEYLIQALEDAHPSYVRATPAGVVSGVNRAIFQAFFTDWLADQTNYEGLELACFDDGIDIFGVLRTVAGGTGTLRNLKLGVGGTKANYIDIDSSGNLTPPAGATVDGVDVDAHASRHDAGGADAMAQGTTGAIGLLELATDAETQAGTDTERAVTPSGLRADVPDSPTAERGVRLNVNGEIKLPSGGDIFDNGQSDTGLGAALRGLRGKLSITDDRVMHPGGWGYPHRDAVWEEWAGGVTSGSYKGSDDFEQDNYGGGTSQWADVGSAAPYSVSVLESMLVLAAKKSNDASSTHAAIYTAINSNTQPSAMFQTGGIVWEYPNYGSDTIGHFCGAGFFDSAYLHGVFWWFEVAAGIRSGSGQTWQHVLYLKRYYHASTAWNPATTGTGAWSTNWTTHKYWNIQIDEGMRFYLYPRTNISRIYYGFGSVRNSSYQIRDIQSIGMSGNFDRFVIFQCRSPHVNSRPVSRWDWVRISS